MQRQSIDALRIDIGTQTQPGSFWRRTPFVTFLETVAYVSRTLGWAARLAKGTLTGMRVGLGNFFGQV